MQGLQGAPVLKGVLIATAGASLFAQATRAQRLSAASRMLVMKTPGELLFSVFLLYSFRVLERHSGTAKFGAFVALSTGISSVLQHTMHRIFRLHAQPATGPYGLIFACVLQFMFIIPASRKFTAGAWRFSDKQFTYFAALQVRQPSGAAPPRHCSGSKERFPA